MDKIAELRAKRAGKVDELTKLIDKMNADNYAEDAADESSYSELKAEIEALDAKIKRVEEGNALKASRAVAVPDQDRPVAYAEPRKRYGALKAFKGANAEADAYACGQFVLASLMGNQKAAAWCRENGLGMYLKTSPAGEAVGSQGGFLVPTVFENTVIDLREQYGTFRKECKLVPMASDNVNWPRRVSGLTAYWLTENSQITDSRKGWGQVALSAKKLAALSLLSTELADDAMINIADDLAQEMAYAFAKAEDAAGWTGDGTSTYGGVTGLKAKFEGGLDSFVGAVNAATGHDTFAEVDGTDLANMLGALPKYAIANAKIYISQQGWALVFERLMAAAGGNNVNTLSGKVEPRWLGYPVVIDQSLPTSSSTINNTPMMYFGDLSLAVLMGERRGFRVKTSDQRYFEFDEIGVQATERVDINVHDVGDATNAGPIVALMGNT